MSRVRVHGFWAQGLSFSELECLGLKVWGIGFKCWGSRLGVLGFGFSALRFKVRV